MDDIKQEFWGDLQVDLYTSNTAMFLMNQRLEEVISTDGKKAHRPILSHSQIGTYTPHSDITFKAKTATKQELSVDTFEYAADDIDATETNQSPYDLLDHSLMSIRKGLMNRFEQVYLSEVVNAFHTISSTPVVVSTTNVLDIFRQAGSRLSSFDVPRSSAMRAVVVGGNVAEIMRQVKSERETGLGDTTLENGVIGEWHGWTVVENNNLPWSATLSIATNPADGDTVTISGMVFEFQDDLGDVAAGNIGVLRHGSTVGTSRANLAAAINDSGTAGTNYIQLDQLQDFVIRRKRNITATSVEAMAFTGFGDISVSSDLTDATDGWSAQRQEAAFMIRGAIDGVLQFIDLEVDSKEKGFAKLPKGLIGMDAKMFQDGSLATVHLPVNAANFI
jgi:hypothetical protein